MVYHGLEADMEVARTNLEGVLVLTPHMHTDGRGMFRETYNRKMFERLNIPHLVAQENESESKLHILRGMHYQLNRAQGKLVRVTYGKAFDVVVDIRPTSPTYRRCITVTISRENRLMLYVPAGYAHGFVSMEEGTTFCYSVDEFYDPADEHGVRYNDSDLNIPWPIQHPWLSAKDRALPFLKDIPLELLPT